MYMKFDVPFWENQNRSGCQFFLKDLQTFLTFVIPTICSILFQQLFHWHRDLCIALNKLPIVASVPQRGAELFDTAQRLQIEYDRNLRKVHHQALSTDHMAEQVSEGDEESALLEI